MFRAFCCLVSMVLVSSTFADEVKKFNPNRLIVSLKKDARLPNSAHYKSAKRLIGNIFILETSNLFALEKDFAESEEIKYMQRDFHAQKKELAKAIKSAPVFHNYSSDKEVEASFFNDPKVRKQWTFKTASKNGISVEDAYRSSATQAREAVIVAVVDTGVDYNHEDLKDVMWVNTGEIAANGIDDDGNGYIDDIHGINTLVRDENGDATADMMDRHSHGTHVSGIIGAKQNNNIGIAGIASNVKIMGIRTVPNSSDELDVDVMEAFVYAAKMGAKIINCSFGKAVNEAGMAVSEVIKEIGEQYGTLVIAAAGNSSQNIDKRLTYPASFENEHLFVIASSTRWGSLSSFSNYGTRNVDVVAPGSAIYSTTPGNKYQSFSGTSMASPTVAGVAAEVLSHFPHLGPLELKKVIMDSVTTKSRFRKKVVTSGQVDLKSALNQVLGVSLAALH